MFEILAKGVIAITIGILFLIVVLIALAGDLLERNPAESRRMQTHRGRNRNLVTWS